MARNLVKEVSTTNIFHDISIHERLWKDAFICFSKFALITLEFKLNIRYPEKDKKTKLIKMDMFKPVQNQSLGDVLQKCILKNLAKFISQETTYVGVSILIKLVYVRTFWQGLLF